MDLHGMYKLIILILQILFTLSGCTHPGAEPPISSVKKTHVNQPQPPDNSLSPSASLQEQHLVEGWAIHPGLLRTQMESWAARAGYQVVWRVSRDYHLQSRFDYSGTYIEALQSFFSGMQHMGNSLRVTVFQGNNVVLISEE